MSVAAISCKQLGDTLLLQPALAELARQHRGEVALHTKAAFSPLIELMPGARLPQPSEGYALAWVFEHGSKAAWQAFRLPAREKCAVLLREGYTRWFHRIVFRRIRTLSERYHYRALDFFRAVGGRDFAPPALHPPPPEWLPARELPRDFTLIGPMAAWESKSWGAAQWARTLEALPGPLVMVGGGSEWELRHAREIMAATRAPVLDLVGKTTLRELLALAAAARAAVAIDGAVAHITAAFSKPTLALFGPTRASEWHWPTVRSVALCSSAHCAEKQPPLTHLPESAVIAAARRLL